jgi:UDP-N-acetylmuramate: L-alanyl-gamma-D-glutamyl-meso-diaminopimelate ligase
VALFNPHTLEMKKMPPLDKEFVKKSFGRDDLIVLDDPKELIIYLSGLVKENSVFLFMSAGNFGGIDLQDF